MKRTINLILMFVLCCAVAMTGCKKQQTSEKTEDIAETTGTVESVSDVTEETGDTIIFDGISFDSCGYNFENESEDNGQITRTYRLIDESNKYDIGQRLDIIKGQDGMTDDDVEFLKTMAENDSFEEVNYGGIDGYQFFSVGLYSFAFEYNGHYYEIGCVNEDDFLKMMNSIKFE